MDAFFLLSAFGVMMNSKQNEERCHEVERMPDEPGLIAPHHGLSAFLSNPSFISFAKTSVDQRIDAANMSQPPEN